MSYILDALRKAERERNLGQVPTLKGLPETPPQPPRRPIAGIMGAALVAVAVLVALNYFLPRKQQQTERKDIPERAEAAAPAAAPNPPTVEVDEPAVEAAPPVIAQQTPPAGARRQEIPEDTFSDAEPTVPDLREPPAQEAAAQANPDTLPAEPAANTSAEPGSSPGEGVLPSLRDMSPEFRRSLPEMKIDAHFYSEDPARRFVMVNLRKYHEGERLAEGPQLERILPDGLQLSFQGQSFRLPLPR